MEKDFDKTFPPLKLFGRGSPMRAELREFLCAWVVYRSDDGLGYVSSARSWKGMQEGPNEEYRRHISTWSAQCFSLPPTLPKRS